MPISQGAGQPVTYRFRYFGALATNAANFGSTDISGTDTLLVDDTGGTGACVVSLPKMGTPLAPIGMRITVRKASTVAQIMSVNCPIDVISSTPGAYPSVLPGTSLHLPASVPNNATFEAMALNKVTGLADPTVGPLVGGIWMNVSSSVAGV